MVISTWKCIGICLIIVLLVILGVFGYYGSKILCTKSVVPMHEWYIVSPDQYICLKDRKLNNVVQWLQRMPYNRSLMGSLIESPYTFEEWLDKGQNINDLESILLRLYDSRVSELLNDSMLEAFGRYGTQKSERFFEGKLRKDNLSAKEQEYMFEVLSVIMKDSEEIEKLKKSLKKDNINHADINFK